MQAKLESTSDMSNTAGSREKLPDGALCKTQCSTHTGWLPTARAAQQQGLNDEVSCCPVSQCRAALMALLDVMAITIK